MYNQQPAYGAAAAPQPVPMMNNYPITGQPKNVTQSGIPFDQLRNDLANFIAQRSNQDACARQLYQDVAGINGNFLTGKMDKLVEMLSITTDFFWRQEPQTPIQQSYGKALCEVFLCAWANMPILYPQLLSDPTMAGQIPTLQQYQNLMQQRIQTFTQMGLMQSNQPVPVSPYATPSFMNGVPPVMSGTPYVPGTMTTTTYNHSNAPYVNGYPQSYGQPVGNGINTSMAMAPNTVTPFVNGMPQQNNQTTSSTPVNHGSDVYAFANQTTHDTTSDIPRDKYGFPLDPKYYETQASSDGNVSNTANQILASAPKPNHPGIDTLNHINQVPKKESVFANLKQPHEVMDKSNSSTIPGNTFIQYGISQLQPNTPNAQPTDFNGYATAREFFEAAHNEVYRESQAISHNSNVGQVYGNKTVDLSDTNVLENLFAEGLRQEDRALPKGQKARGLKDDEVRYLTNAERWELYRRGVEFEYPNLTPITARPMVSALHAILTVDNKVRQIVTPIEDIKGGKVDLAAHEDILAPMRNNSIVQRDENAVKHMTSTFVETSRGGVVYDRFAAAKVVLQNSVSEAFKSSKDDAEAFNKKLDEAFDKFDEQAKKDLYDDQSGVAAFRAANPTDDDTEGDEDFSNHPLLDKEEQERRKAQAEALLRPETIEGEISIGGALDIETHVLLNDAVNTDPVILDRSRRVSGGNTRIAAIFNTSKERDNVLDLFADFKMSSEAITDLAEKDKVLGTYFADKLVELKDKAHPAIWNRLNKLGTEMTNLYLKHSIGVNLRIDDFTEDYRDLIDLLFTDYQDEVPNIDDALAYMDGTIGKMLKCLRDSSEIYTVEDDNNVDLLGPRAIFIDYHHLSLYLPMVSDAAGFVDEIVSVTKDSDAGLFNILKEMHMDATATRCARSKFAYSIQNVYINFNDGQTYLVMPRIGKLPDCTNPDEFFQVFTCIRVPYFA